jgi:prepilin-type N-terminal cleavage/methylation domain-containing protein
MKHRAPRFAFTLIEILVVLAIIALLAALIFPTLARVRENGRAISCASNLKQIGLALMQYSEDYEGFHPVAGGSVAWDAIDPVTQNNSWMQQMQSYVKNKQIFHCPSDSASEYSYFLSARVAYLEAHAFAATNTKRIQFPTAFVVAGDTFS